MDELNRQMQNTNIMDGGIDDMRQVGGNMMVGGVVPNLTNNVHRRTKTKVTMHAMMSEALPLDEAARLEMKALPSKTPVSVLQELLSRRGTTPNYELVQIEGAIHEPTFRYRVTVADVVAMGTGRSKKEAKHAAAKAVLDKLIGVNTDSAEAPITNSIPDSQNIQEIQSGYGEEKVVNNPIGSLQELCMSRHWPPPKYSMEGEEGLPHERQFTIVCTILKYHQVGQGKSKKLAKRQAAHKMWQSLQELNNTNRTTGEDDEIVPKNANVSAHFADLKDSKISTLTTPHSHKVSQFHKNLKSSTGVKLFELQHTCLNDGDVNLVQFLQEIASEQQFEVTYVDIEEKSITGKCQCLVQLSTLPVAVCYGSGMTSKDAQAAAAQNALEYLKIMTKNDDQNSNSEPIKTESDINKAQREASKIHSRTAIINGPSEIIFNSTNSATRNNNKKISNMVNDNGRVKANIGRFGGGIRNSTSSPSDDQLAKSKDYCGKKITNDLGAKMKNYHFDYSKDNSINQQDYKTRSIANLTPRVSNQTSSSFQRDNNRIQYPRDESKSNYNSIYAVARKSSDQQPEATPVNFPPLRAPQSIVNMRHPFVAESRVKQKESNGLKSKSIGLQSKDTYRNFSTSTVRSAYPRPDSFAQQTLSSVLFPDTGQFSQPASSYSTNQFQTYDHSASYQPMSQFSESSMSFAQFESQNFVQSNHYSTADLSSNQFQYHTSGIAHPQESPMFIQNPIAMSDQYGTTSYGRGMRTEMMHRLHRPTKFNK